MDIVSIFMVVDYKTKEKFTEAIEGSGQDAIGWVRKDYPRFSKFVLRGFEINGKFVPLRIR